MPTPVTTDQRLDSKVAGTAAFSKFMHLLQLVADHPEPLNVAALSKLSGYPRATVHRTVAALVAERLLEESPQSGRLVLGPRLIQLASRSWSRSDLRQVAMEDLKRLRDLTGETIHLAVLNGQQMVYVEKLESPSAVRMTSRIGTNICLHSTAVGKAYLAAMSKSLRDNLIASLPSPFAAFTPNTIVAPAALREELVHVANRGWSVDNEEQELGIHCFGAAIIGVKGEPIAAISVSTLRFRQRENPEQVYVKPLLETCSTIGKRIAETPALADADAF